MYYDLKKEALPYAGLFFLTSRLPAESISV